MSLEEMEMTGRIPNAAKYVQFMCLCLCVCDWP